MLFTAECDRGTGRNARSLCFMIIATQVRPQQVCLHTPLLSIHETVSKCITRIPGTIARKYSLYLSQFIPEGLFDKMLWLETFMSLQKYFKCHQIYMYLFKCSNHASDSFFGTATFLK